MKLLKVSPFIALLLVGALMLTSCGQSSITKELQLVIAGVEAVLPLIPGVTPDAAVKINTYLSAVSDGAEYATVELASADSEILKASRIAAKFASIAAPVLPAGTAQAILTDIENVAAAVQRFLSVIQAAPVTARAAGQPVQLTKGDLAALPKLHARAVALQANFAK